MFAREPLWKIGLDYRHGTGHGIGHFLNIHEGTVCYLLGVLDEMNGSEQLSKMVMTRSGVGYQIPVPFPA